MPSPEGSGTNGVLLLGEALGIDEERTGKPFQGRAGEWLTRTLLRRGHDRSLFTIDNVLRCRPPDNKLNHQPYEGEAVRRCRPFLDTTLRERRPKVVVAMGEIPLQRIFTLDKSEKITPWRGYVTWSPTYQCWVVPTWHPSFLMRGNQNLSGVFLHDIELALEIAAHGWIPHNQHVVEDPPPYVVEGWVAKYEEALRRDPLTTWLAYDIETPYKASQEDEGELDVDDPSFIVIRIGFAWKGGEALSIPWQGHYIPAIKRLLGSTGIKLVWNGRYDNPRILANGVDLRGEVWDLMWGWHVINSDLPKGLSFVAPMLAQGQGRWKHLSKTSPARYNGIDAEVTRRIADVLVPDLKRHHLWEVVFKRHVVMLDVVLDAMSSVGVQTDHAARLALSGELTTALDALGGQMQAVVPLAGKRLKTYKGKPKGVVWERGDPVPEGFTLVEGSEEVAHCSVCGLESPKKPHFRILKKKVNPCAIGEALPSTRACQRLARIEKFVPSNTQMQTYLHACHHTPQFTKGRGVDRRITFDDLALGVLRRKYPQDPLYPLVLDYRGVEKLKGTYAGDWDPLTQRWVSGPPVDTAGVVHTIFLHAPSTLRLSSRAPNLQNIPRASEANPLAARIKRLYIPRAGYALFEADYKAIEAVIVGYLANDWLYTRLAKLGVHDFLNSHILARAGKITAPADPAWSDGDLKGLFKELKARFPSEREVAKRIVHGSNYGITPSRMFDLYPEYFAKVRDAAILQGIYFEVCPGVKRWQARTIEQADDTGYLRNPFGYLHRFFQVREWKKERDGSWASSWGEDAKRALAFLPQSTAAGVIKEAMLALWYEEALGAYLRLQVHDSLVFEFPLAHYETLAVKAVEVMSRPSPYLELPWSLGEHLDVEVEVKGGGGGVGWGDLKEVRVGR